MRILILNSEYPPIGGGAGNASAHIAQDLVAQGQEVTVLTSTFARLPREEIRDGVRIIRLPSLRRRADRSSALEQLIFMLVAIPWGFAWVLKLDPQIVLAFFGAPGGVAAWAWSFFRRLPYVVCLRGGDVPGFRPYDFGLFHRLLGPLLRMVWRRAAAVVANSRGLRELGVAFEPRVPIRVIPNGVEVAKFQVDQRDWQPARMLFVGRLVYQKGLDLLLNALADLIDIPWQLSIVGDGPRKDWLWERAADLGLVGRINFEGWQARESLRQYFREANLFVYPSRHEGMPNALLEAMAGGLPAIATRIAGNEELVKEGKTGLLIPPDDVEALRNALQNLLSDAALRESMGKAALQRARTKHSWKDISDRYLALLEELAQKA